MNRQSITKNELLGGIAVLGLLIVVGIFTASIIQETAEENYLKYQLALKITEPNHLEHAKSTQVGDTLVYGKIEAEEPQSIPDLKGEYSVVEKVKQRYTQHTRTVSYSCGESTCTRLETYYTWDRVHRDTEATQKYYILDTVFGNICTPNIYQLRNLEGVYQGEHHVKNGYAYEKDRFFALEGDIRYSYYIKEKRFKGTVFIRFFDNKITDPIHPDSCLKVNEDKEINQVVKDAEPKYLFIWLMTIVGVIIFASIYFYVAYTTLDF